MDTYSQFAISVGILIALVELAKNVGFSKKYSPLLSLGFGVFGFAFVCFLSGATMLFEYKECLFTGLLAGLTASGVYGNAEMVFKKRKV